MVRMPEQKRQPDTQADIIERKSKQLDKLEQESDEERPGNPRSYGPGTDNEGDPDQYGLQDQFGDVDGQDPYSNLDDQEPADTSEDEDRYDEEQGLYGLAEPLANEGDVSKQGGDKNRYGTRQSQDQQGYQQ